jgi:hypothetical protein
MFSNGPKIITTGLSLLADASDQLSYPGAGNAWTDLITGTTASLSGSISFTTDYLGSLVTANSSSVIIFPPSTANFGSETFTVEFAFRPTQINGQHWILSKNSGSFPNWGVYLTGSAGSGRLVAFFNISSTISCSLVSPTASITTGSNYIVDASLVPSIGVSRLYINSETAAIGSANGSGSLSATSPLFFSNINSGSNSGTVNSVFNIKTYTPRLTLGSVRQNYNALGNRLGLSSKAWIAPVTDSLLDFYPGAAAAYSLRQLSSEYEGYAIRVRNSSDQELDIGFNSSGELDTVTLLNHCGAGDGFVKTWYDQSGNSINATQITAINQPQIVSSGSVILENGKPVLDFDGSNDLLTILNVPIFSNVSGATLITVNKSNSTAVLGISSLGVNFTGGINTNLWIAQGRTIAKRYETGGRRLQDDTFAAITSNTDSNGQALIINNTNFVNTTIDLYQNASLVANSTTFQTSGNTAVINQNIIIGSTGVSRYWNGNIQEIIIYPSDQSSNRTGIETNINSFYNIY